MMLTSLTALLRIRPIIFANRYQILSSLFKKRNEQKQQEKKIPPPSAP